MKWAKAVGGASGAGKGKRGKREGKGRMGAQASSHTRLR